MATQQPTQQAQPTMTPEGVPILGAQPVQLVNVDPVLITFAVLGVAQNGPNYPVPPGCLVRVKGSNDTAVGNAGTIFVASNKLAAQSGPFRPIEPKYEIVYCTDNLNKIWGQGAAGDGMVLSISGR